jgi:hypothetical protein
MGNIKPKRGGEKEVIGEIFDPTRSKISPNHLVFSPFPREGGGGMGLTTKLKRTQWPGNKD